MSEENKKVAIEEEVKSVPLQKLPNLRSLREERELTIEDIFLKTRIDVAILKAIENGEFYLLPKPVYAKKFIESYAESIGTDAGIILAHYQRYVNEKQAVPEQVIAVEEQVAFDRKPIKRYLLLVVPAVAIIAIVFIMYNFFQNQEPQGGVQHKVTVDAQKEVAPAPAPVVKERPLEPVVPTTPPPAAVSNIPQTPPPAAVNNVSKTPPPAIIPKETTQTPSKARLNLLIEAKEDTWLKITADNKPPQEVTLKTGQKLNRDAREFFVIDVGNAAGVNINFQGKSLGNLGRKGQVVHLRLPQQ